MFKQYLLTLIALLVASVVFASDLSKTQVTRAEQVSTAKKGKNGSQGINNGLSTKNLKFVFEEVMQIKGGKIGEIIETFQSTTAFWAWTVQEGELPENVNGRTMLTADGMLTILDNDKLKNATNLSVAWTIIHEMIHAYLTLLYRFDPKQAKEDYPDIYTGWQINKHADYNQLQHEEIEKKFIDAISDALKEYGSIVNLNINNAVYEDLAWGGLNFNNSNLLSDLEKERVQDRLVAEQLNRRSGTEVPVGIKKAR